MLALPHGAYRVGFAGALPVAPGRPLAPHRCLLSLRVRHILTSQGVLRSPHLLHRKSSSLVLMPMHLKAGCNFAPIRHIDGDRCPRGTVPAATRDIRCIVVVVVVVIVLILKKFARGRGNLATLCGHLMRVCTSSAASSIHRFSPLSSLARVEVSMAHVAVLARMVLPSAIRAIDVVEMVYSLTGTESGQCPHSIVVAVVGLLLLGSLGALLLAVRIAAVVVDFLGQVLDLVQMLLLADRRCIEVLGFKHVVRAGAFGLVDNFWANVLP